MIAHKNDCTQGGTFHPQFSLTSQCLTKILQSCSPRLERLTLAGCGPFGDAGLAHMPPTIKHLVLVSAHCVVGTTLVKARKLQTVKLFGCFGITSQAMRSMMIGCKHLQVVSMPKHLALESCLPVVPARSHSHVDGIEFIKEHLL